MEFKDLVGLHELSGIDTSIELIQWGNWSENANVYLFVLDGITYKAVEDPADGYRSMCKELEICIDKVSYRFPPQKVVGKMKDDDKYGNNDVIQFYDFITDKLVLEIGTENYDDWYPTCVMNWYPENLFCNENK